MKEEKITEKEVILYPLPHTRGERKEKDDKTKRHIENFLYWYWVDHLHLPVDFEVYSRQAIQKIAALRNLPFSEKMSSIRVIYSIPNIYLRLHFGNENKDEGKEEIHLWKEILETGVERLLQKLDFFAEIVNLIYAERENVYSEILKELTKIPAYHHFLQAQKNE